MSTPKKRNGHRDQPIEVIDPRSNYRGKSYSEWTTDWFNWFLSTNPDRHNSGPVVFLRSLPMPVSGDSHTIFGSPNEAEAVSISDSHIDRYYQPNYMNDPNIKVGADRLQIYDDQAVFVPIINAYQFSSISQYADWGTMQDFTGSLIDNGDDPPDNSQITIKYNDNYEDLQLPVGMEQFRVCTPIFTALVPDAPYGTSLKDFLEEGSIQPGNYHAIVEGYFIMLKFNQLGNYLVNCWASSGREVQGHYFSQLIYQIEVLPKNGRGGIIPGVKTKRYPARNQGILNEILKKKIDNGELNDTEAKTIRDSNTKIKRSLGLQ